MNGGDSGPALVPGRPYDSAIVQRVQGRPVLMPPSGSLDDDQIEALVKDLKAHGLLEETLIVFSGEFGRTPFVQGTNGRDHNPMGFSMWMAGGGLKKDFIYGQTDEYGYRVIENAHTVRDLHATMLHLLGLDYTNLTYRFGGRNFRLTDVDGRPIRDILA